MTRHLCKKILHVPIILLSIVLAEAGKINEEVDIVLTIKNFHLKGVEEKEGWDTSR